MDTSPPPPDRAGLVALVADGSVAGNRLVRRALASLGVTRVLEAQDGAELLGAFAEGKPDLLVIDWHQSVVAAAEIMAAVRDETRSHAPALPVLATMADPTRAEVDAALALKVDAIVAKPTSLAILRRRLELLVPAAARPA